MKFLTAASALSMGAVLAHSQTWTANPNGSGDRPKSEFDDDFTTNSLVGTQWTAMDSVKGGNSNTNPASTPGQLTLKGRGTDIWSTANEFNSASRRISGQPGPPRTSP